jgi:hypothetical protein
MTCDCSYGDTDWCEACGEYVHDCIWREDCLANRDDGDDGEPM